MEEVGIWYKRIEKHWCSIVYGEQNGDEDFKGAFAIWDGICTFYTSFGKW